jgi:hypothetical protein
VVEGVRHSLQSEPILFLSTDGFILGMLTKPALRGMNYVTCEADIPMMGTPVDSKVTRVGPDRQVTISPR